MYDHILIPTDGSDGALAAATWARDTAMRFGSTVDVIHVSGVKELPPAYAKEFEGAFVEEGRELLQDVTALLDAADIQSSHALLASGDPVHEVIINYAVNHDIDCITMGTTGRTGLRRLALGSVAGRTLRGATMPVVTVRADATVDAGVKNILVPTDGSPGAEAAADHAIQLAIATDAALHVVHTVDIQSFGFDDGMASMYDALQSIGEEAIEAVRTRALEAEVRSVEASLLSGGTHRSILDYTKQRDIDAIVMGTHGRRGLQDRWLGSVTERVVRGSRVPVITVKPESVLAKLDRPEPVISRLDD